MNHHFSEAIFEIGDRFGLELQKFDHSYGIWRVWDSMGRQYAIKMFRQGISSLVLSSNVHIKAGKSAPGLLPTLLTTSEQLPFLYYKGSHFIGMNWIKGRNLDYFRLSDRLRALQALIYWQKAVQSVEVPKSLRLWRKRRLILEERIQEMKECRKMAERLADGFSQVYLKDWNFYYRYACSARACLDAEEYKVVEEESECRGEICHQDWAHHNLILRNNGNLSVLDLEYVQGNIGVLDLIDLLNRFLQLDRGNPKAIPMFFNWLKRLRPLMTEEMRSFQMMFKWPTTYWMLGRQYFIEQIYRNQCFALERYWRKVPRPRYWEIWQEVLAESLGLSRFK